MREQYAVHALLRITTIIGHYYDGVCGEDIRDILAETRQNIGATAQIEVISVHDSCEELNNLLDLYQGF